MEKGVDNRCSFPAKVKHLWEDTYEKMEQSGVLEDESGTVRFVSWKSSDPPVVEEGVRYMFEDLRVDEYQDEKRMIIDNYTDVTEIYREE